MQMLLNGGKYNGKQILSNRTVEMITSNQLDFHFNGTDDFGLGFEIVTDKGAANGPRSKGVSRGWILRHILLGRSQRKPGLPDHVAAKPKQPRRPL